MALHPLCSHPHCSKQHSPLGSTELPLLPLHFNFLKQSNEYKQSQVSQWRQVWTKLLVYVLLALKVTEPAYAQLIWDSSSTVEMQRLTVFTHQPCEVSVALGVRGWCQRSERIIATDSEQHRHSFQSALLTGRGVCGSGEKTGRDSMKCFPDTSQSREAIT